MNVSSKNSDFKDSYKGSLFGKSKGSVRQEMLMPMHFVADQPYFTEESVEGFLEKMEREAKSCTKDV